MSVVEIKTHKVEVSEDVVAALEGWLKEARSGELAGVALAGIYADGTTRTEATKTVWFQALLGAIIMLQHRMLRDNDV